MLRKATIVALTVAAVGGAGLPLMTASAAEASTVTGVVFEDHDRDGRLSTGDVPLPDVVVRAFDAATSRYRAGVVTDSAGRYAFSDLPDDQTRVLVDSAWWSSRRNDWVATTTGTLTPDTTVTGSGTADFGVRRIVRSTQIGSPISAFTGPEGFRTESYNDVVSARQVYDTVKSGTLVGAEAAKIMVRLDAGPHSSASTSVGQQDGRYTDYSSTVYVAWSAWLTDNGGTLFHEYGHAWSLYYAYVVQQDPSLGGYLRARGLEGDARVGSSYEWSPRELIAEDYRQLFGSPSAREQGQMNTAVPPAASVAGLADYLSGTFRQTPTWSPTPSPSPSPSSSPSPSPAPALTAPVVNPTTVKTSAVVSSSVSTAARVVVSIVDAKGSLVRTILDAAVPAGTITTSWDRKNDRGQRVKAGQYAVRITATDEQARTTAATTAFSVA